MERTLLGDVHPDHHFVARNGARIKNILELYNSVKDMDDITFNHHVNDFKNDFHNWVRDICKDNELAKALLEASTKNEMIDVLKAKVGNLQTAKQEIKPVVKKPELVVEPEKVKESIVKKIVKKAVKTIKAAKPVKIIKKKPKVTKAPKEIKKIKPELNETIFEKEPEQPKTGLLSEVEAVDKTIPEIGIMEAENIIEQERYYERPRLLRLTPGDFALGLIIGTIAGLVIANFI